MGVAAHKLAVQSLHRMRAAEGVDIARDSTLVAFMLIATAKFVLG